MEQPEGPDSIETPCDPTRNSEIRAYLERLVTAPVFSSAPRRVRLLKYLLERTLAGEGDRVNEYSLGIDVFDKLPSFDPRSDSMVRTDVMRLRQRLRQYYSEEGGGDAIVLDIPPKSYRIAIEFRDTAVPAIAAIVPVPPVGRNRIWILLATAVAVLVVGLAAGIVWRWYHGAKQPIRSVVVLPFQDFSSDHQSGYLADGLTDEITNDLANLDGLRVIARTTAFEFKGKGIDIRDIGRQLHVDASLEGSLDREGDRVRIRAQLNRNADGYHLWSHVYDVQFRDLISVQRDIARSIAGDLQLSRSFDGEGGVNPPRHDPSPEAHELYLRGSEAWNAATLESFRKGAVLFQAAADKDPQFAEAWLGLANAHWNLGLFSGWKEVSVAQVESEARHAVDRNPRLGSAHATIGQIMWRRDFDWPRAESEFRLALQYGNGSYNVHNLYAGCLAERGMFAEGHRQFRLAEELSPLQDAIFTNEAALYWAEGRVSEAEQMYRQVLEKKPGYALALAGMAGLRLRAKDCAGAAEYGVKLNKASPGSRAAIIVEWALAPCTGEAAVTRMQRNVKVAGMRNIDAAVEYAALGNRDTAIEYLKKSAELHEIGATSLKVSPYFEAMRSDPRFVALEREIGIAP
jgi:TolB-like protein/Tfp pilus assembly protein PilF